MRIIYILYMNKKACGIKRIKSGDGVETRASALELKGNGRGRRDTAKTRTSNDTTRCSIRTATRE